MIQLCQSHAKAKVAKAAALIRSADLQVGMCRAETRRYGSERAGLKPGATTHAECSWKSRSSCWATILSSSGCSMNEFMVSPGLSSATVMTIEGSEFLS